MEIEEKTKVVFDEYLLTEKQNEYDYGFIALDVNREDVVDLLLENAASLSTRNFLSLEIQNFFLNAYTQSQKNTRETKDFLVTLLMLLYSKGYDIHNQAVQKIQQVFDQAEDDISGLHKWFAQLIEEENQSITKVQALLREIQLKLGPVDFNLKDLELYLDNKNDIELNDILHQIKKTQKKIKSKFQDFTSEEVVYRSYIQTYYRKKGWMALPRESREEKSGCILDFIAMMKNYQIFVWTNGKTSEGREYLELIYRTKKVIAPQTNYHVKFSEGHFTKLIFISSSGRQGDLGSLPLHIVEGEIRSVLQNNASSDLPDKEEEVETQCQILEGMKLSQSQLVRNLTFCTRSDSFKQFIQSKIFVDKSLFIKEIIDGPQNVLITRPRRWGKTLNMRMLEAFLEVHVPRDELTQIPLTRSFFDGGIVNGIEYRKLKIANSRFYIEKYQGQYPTIFLTLKDVLADSKDEQRQQVEDRFRLQVSRVFRTKQYLLNSLEPEDQEKFHRIMYCEDCHKDDYITLIPFLIRQLHIYHKKRVYLLVDEYDRCVNNMLQNEIFPKSEKAKNYKVLISIAKFISYVLSPCCKGNNNVEKIVITGIYDTIIREYNSGVNNIEVFGLDTDNSYLFNPYFGFSTEEIQEQLLDPIFVKNGHEKSIKHVLHKAMAQHFNGYTLSLGGEKVFQSYGALSAYCYMENIYDEKYIRKKPNSYWNMTGGSEILENLSLYELGGGSFNKLIELSQRKPVKFYEIPTPFNLLDAFKPPETGKYKLEQRALIYILVNSGYVTRVNRNEPIYKIPNQEILEYFGRQVVTKVDLLKKYKVDNLDSLIHLETTGQYGILNTGEMEFEKIESNDDNKLDEPIRAEIKNLFQKKKLNTRGISMRLYRLFVN